MDSKVCTKCKQSKPLDQFYVELRAADGRESSCNVCQCIVSRDYQLRRVEKEGDSYRISQNVRKSAQKRRKRRTDRAWAICTDSKAADRKYGREYGLTYELVRSLIEHPCVYCGDTSLLRTLDRKDNNLGHVPDNVVPCCIRCNYVRRNMPYGAWLVVARAMREAREQGLFGGWTCIIPSLGRSQEAL